MFRQTLLAAALALASFVSAQNYSTSGPINITASSVPYSTRYQWCITEKSTCPTICGGLYMHNDCNPNDLSYLCVCENGNTPNISNYQQTLPSLICQKWQQDCVAANPNNLEGQSGCLSVKCGNMTADSITASSSSSSMASGMATASATASSSGSASSASSSAPAASSSSTSAAMGLVMNYGSGLLAASMLAIFGLVL